MIDKLKRFLFKIRIKLEAWNEYLNRWWDTHLCAVSRSAARSVVMERDMLRDQLEELEDSTATEIEKLTNETIYLKDELAYEHMRNKRLEDELQTVRDRDYKDIYPGLQAEIERLTEENQKLQEKIEELREKLKDSWTMELVKKDEVPTETASEDS